MHCKRVQKSIVKSTISIWKSIERIERVHHNAVRTVIKTEFNRYVITLLGKKVHWKGKSVHANVFVVGGGIKPKIDCKSVDPNL